MFGDGPILVDSYLQDATELDVDCLRDASGETFVAGIMQHIEEAGIHSGDSACSLPAYSLDEKILTEIKKQTEALAHALNVIGLMNVQFAVKHCSSPDRGEVGRGASLALSEQVSLLPNPPPIGEGTIYLIEVNPRASRTVPFVAKSIGIPIAKIAARLMAGASLKDVSMEYGITKHETRNTKHVAVKEAVFPFARFAGVDVILGPEMKSTGEAMGIDSDFPRAFAKSQLSAGSTIPKNGTVFVSVKESDKALITPAIRELVSLGFSIIATRGTAKYLNEQGLEVSVVNKVREGRPHIVDMLKDGKIALVINTTEGGQSVTDSFSIRRTALLGKIPYYTTIAGAKAIASAISAINTGGGLDVRSIQSYFDLK